MEDGNKCIGSFIVLILISNSVLCTKEDTKESHAPAMPVGAEAAVMPIPPEGVEKHLTSNPPPKDAQAPPVLGNVIAVPDNCPPGEKLIEGHCRAILKAQPDAKH